MIVMFVKLLMVMSLVVSMLFGLALSVEYLRSKVREGVKMSEDNRMRRLSRTFGLTLNPVMFVLIIWIVAVTIEIVMLVEYWAADDTVSPDFLTLMYGAIPVSPG